MSVKATHEFKTKIEWTGNKGDGTTTYEGYGREYTVSSVGKQDILCSSAAGFLGDVSKFNPEDMFIASLSSCHMLWYLHLCADNGIKVLSYHDETEATLGVFLNGKGFFQHITLKPTVVIEDAEQIQKAIALHQKANKMCFLANSLHFPIKHIPTVTAQV
jgi:organic hydroperoxide reductase OsmC/OhrA